MVLFDQNVDLFSNMIKDVIFFDVMLNFIRAYTRISWNKHFAKHFSQPTVNANLNTT